VFVDRIFAVRDVCLAEKQPWKRLGGKEVARLFDQVPRYAGLLVGYMRSTGRSGMATRNLLSVTPAGRRERRE